MLTMIRRRRFVRAAESAARAADDAALFAYRASVAPSARDAARAADAAADCAIRAARAYKRIPDDGVARADCAAAEAFASAAYTAAARH